MAAYVGKVLFYNDIRQLYDILDNGRIEDGAIRRMLASGSAARIRMTLCLTGNDVTEATKRDILEKDSCSNPHKNIGSVERVMETAEMLHSHSTTQGEELHSLSTKHGEDVSSRGYFGDEAAATKLELSVELRASFSEPEIMDVKSDKFIMHDSHSDIRTPGPPIDSGVSCPPNDRGVPGPPNDRSVPEPQIDLDVSGTYVRNPSWQLPERTLTVLESRAPTRIASVSERVNMEDIENIRKDSDRHWTGVTSQSTYRLLGSDMILQVIRL